MPLFIFTSDVEVAQTSMKDSQSRQTQIEILASDGRIEELKGQFKSGYTQLEIDIALENAIAYSQIETAESLLSLGADISNYNYQAAYYAAHNNELNGVKFVVASGIDVNMNNGMLLNTSIIAALNTGSTELVKWLLENGASANLLSEQSLNLVRKHGTDELKNLLEKTA